MLSKYRQAMFWDKCNAGEIDHCWLWSGYVKRGVGIIQINGKQELVHRVSYMLATGNSVQFRRVSHTCGHKLCCNPGHIICAGELGYSPYNISKVRRLNASKGRIQIEIDRIETQGRENLIFAEMVLHLPVNEARACVNA